MQAESEGMEKILHENKNEKRGVVILEKIGLKTKNVTEDKGVI